MTKHCNNFLEFVEAKIGNDNQPLFYGTDKDRVYYSAFGVTNDAEDNMLPYGENIQYQKQVEVNQDYIEELDNYIEAKLFVPGKYSITVLAQVKLRNRVASGNPIGE